MNKLFVQENGKIQPWLQLMTLLVAIVVMQVVIGIILGIIIGVVASMQGSIMEAPRMLEGLMRGSAFNAIASTLGSVITILIVFGLYKLLNKKAPLKNMGMTSIKKDYKDFLIGLALGIVSISILVLILALTGDYKFAGFHFNYMLPIGLILFIAVGFSEEIMVRGFMQHVLEEKRGIIWAIVIPSIIFSLLHFGNPNISSLGAVNLALVGIVFAVMTYKTGNLWTAIGYHITWNFVQGNIFGIEVSGTEQGMGLIHFERTGNRLLNGGFFGLEGSILCTIIISLTLLYYLFLYKKRV